MNTSYADTKSRRHGGKRVVLFWDVHLVQGTTRSSGCAFAGLGGHVWQRARGGDLGSPNPGSRGTFASIAWPCTAASAPLLDPRWPKDLPMARCGCGGGHLREDSFGALAAGESVWPPNSVSRWERKNAWNLRIQAPSPLNQLQVAPSGC